MIRKSHLAVFMVIFTFFSAFYIPVMASPAQKSVIFLDNGHSIVYTTTATTVQDFMIEQGIVLTPKDQMNLDYMHVLDSGETLDIKRGFYVNVSIDDKEERVKVSQQTTAGVLIAALEKERKQKFIYEGSLLTVLAEGSNISLSARLYKTVTEIVVVDFETQTVTTPDLNDGTKKVTQEGAPGEKEVTIKVAYDDETEISREIISEKITVEPIPRIVKEGNGKAKETTAAQPKKADTSSADFEYERVLTMTATAYTAGPESTGKSPGMPGYGVTASGMRVAPGVVAVDPRVIPLGTRLYVEGYGYAIAADTGGAIKGNKIDLYMEKLSDAYQFGRRTVTVYVLE